MQTATVDFSKVTHPYTYNAFKELMAELVANGKTTGPNQTEGLIDTTKMNLHRMARIEKTTKLNAEVLEALQNVNSKWTWYVILEGWCGDASQLIGVFAKMAETNPNIDLQFILRDENPEIMDAYETNGARAIPILVCVNENGEEVGRWGPRPQAIQEKVLALKAEGPEVFKAEFGKKLHLWYAQDKTQSVQKEFAEALSHWNA